MKKLFTTIMLFVATVMMCNRAWADGQHTINMQSENAAWATSSTDFQMSDIAAELGTDAATLYNAILAWKGASYASDLFCLKMEDDTWSYNHGSAADGAFYIGQDGSFHDGWGDAAGYCRLDYTEETLSITIGQTGSVEKGDIKCVVSLNYGGQTVVFDATLSIIVPEIDKTPVTTISDLEIVGRTKYTHTMQPDETWAAETNSIPVAGIASLLDIDPAYMEENFSAMLYAKHYSSNNESWDAELAHKFTATPNPGFWFNKGVFDEESQQESAELTHGEWLGTAENICFIVSLAYDSQSETVNCGIGQYPGAWALGDNHTADIYIVYGSKAYVITYDLTVDVNQDNTIEKYNNVGSEDITINRDPRGSWFELDSIKLDTAKILELFGDDVKFDDLTLFGEDKYGNITNAYTADAPGFWFTPEGAVKGFENGVASFYVDLITDTIVADPEQPENFTIERMLAIGNIPDMFKGGEACTARLFLMNGEDYYTINLTVNINSPAYTIQTCEIVEEVNINVKLVPTTSSWQTGTTDVTFLNDIIGTTSGKFYGINASGEYTDAYSVSEATTYGGGGFWMSEADETGTAYAAGYSSTGAYAIWYYNNTITWFNNPGFNQIGENNYGTFYLANLWDGKAVKLNVSIKYVANIVTIPLAGEEDITAAARSEEGSFSITKVDLNACTAALECTLEELYTEAEWFILDEEGNETLDNFQDDLGYIFNKDGYPTSEEDMTFAAGFFEDELHVFVFNEEDVENTYTTVLYAKFNEKTYAFNITIMSPEAVGISSTKVIKPESTRTFHISGRAASAVDDIMIRNGKKYIAR